MRKKNNETKARAPPRRAPSRQLPYRNYETEPSANDSILSANFSRQRSGTSISSGSEVDQYGRRQTLPQMETGIEKSALRTFMDSKSDKVRNALASTISGNTGKMDDPSPMRPESSASRDNSYDPSLGTSPIAIPTGQRPLMSRNLESSYDYERGHVASRGGSTDLGPQIRQWSGGGKLPMSWNKLKRVSFILFLCREHSLSNRC